MTVDPRLTLAAVVFAAALPPGSESLFAQQALEPVVAPLTEQYEQAVQDQMEAARDDVERLQNDPATEPGELAAAFGLLGQLYLLYDFSGPAGAALRNAERLDPTDPRWPYHLAEIATAEGDLDATVSALDRSLALDPRNLAAVIQRANALFDLGRIDEAETDYLRILDRVPDQSAARFGVGRISYERGEFEQAIEHFETAIRAQPEGSVIHHHIGLALRRLGRRDEAATHLAQNKHRVVLFPDPLRDRVDLLNASSEAHYFRGTAALRRGDARAAISAFRVALEAKPNDARTTFSIGLAQIELGNKQAAETRMRQAIALDGNYREPHFNLGLILAERNDYEAAERHFGRAAEIDPLDFEASARRADALTRLGRAQEAIEVLHQVLDAEPAMPVALLTLGAAYQAIGEAEQAAAKLDEVLDAAPGAPRERAEAHYRLSLISLKDGLEDGNAANDESALTHLQQAVALDPTLTEAHALLGRLLARRSEYSAAAGAYARAIARDPANAVWHRDRAMALILGRRYVAARQALTSGLDALERSETSSSNATTQHLELLLARLLAACPDPQVRDGRRALALARRLMTNRPSLEHAETMAMALAESGDFEQAADLQQQVLAEVERRGGVPSVGQRQRMENYLAGSPAREPWFSG